MDYLETVQGVKVHDDKVRWKTNVSDYHYTLGFGMENYLFIYTNLKVEVKVC